VAKSPRAFLDAMVVPVRYDHAGADELLQNTGITCPPLESYVAELVGYVKQWLEARDQKRDVEAHDPLA
jgi:hypothetical protein